MSIVNGTASRGDRAEKRALTGLRGLCCLYVMFYHFEYNWGIAHPHGVFATFANHGYLSVDIFFILSGLVMGLVYDQDNIRMNFPRYRSFLAHRVARIFPLYIVVTLAIGVLVTIGIGKSHNSLPEIAANLVFLQIFLPVDNMNGPSWSVGYEWVSYLLFPLFLFLVRCRKTAAWLLIGVILLGLW